MPAFSLLCHEGRRQFDAYRIAFEDRWSFPMLSYAAMTKRPVVEVLIASHATHFRRVAIEQGVRSAIPNHIDELNPSWHLPPKIL